MPRLVAFLIKKLLWHAYWQHSSYVAVTQVPPFVPGGKHTVFLLEFISAHPSDIKMTLQEIKTLLPTQEKHSIIGAQFREKRLKYVPSKYYLSFLRRTHLSCWLRDTSVTTAFYLAYLLKKYSTENLRNTIFLENLQVVSFPANQNLIIKLEIAGLALQLKLKLRVFLTSHSAAMVIYCLTKMVTTCMFTSDCVVFFLVPWL